MEKDQGRNGECWHVRGRQHFLLTDCSLPALLIGEQIGWILRIVIALRLQLAAMRLLLRHIMQGVSQHQSNKHVFALMLVRAAFHASQTDIKQPNGIR
jgi:hypothetical protein